MTATRSSGKHVVWLVQQGVWDMPKESMPLGVGYVKAAAMAEEVIRREVDIRIFNFTGGDTTIGIAQRLFCQPIPDIIGFSVWGWNYRQFAHLAETFKQLRPEGWVVFGGNHVANQGERTLREHPQVDVVVNAEGEFIFQDLLHAFLAGQSVHDLDGVSGITFRGDDGQIRTTPSPPRIQDLDSIPSPFLTGAIPLVDHNGEFRYDVALMETNRGCPYRCAFCYWGGAVGQKVRLFSRERLREELEVFAHHRVHTIVLCDANFGMLPQDAQFIEDFIQVRARRGYPRALESSWAKNKSKVFFDIVHRMKEAGISSSFNLALQTLNDSALQQMGRRNMRLNEWEDLVRWLKSEGLDCYAELIWGAPGETVDTFLEGYDRLARHMTRIASYQMLLLPNTEYVNSQTNFGFVTVRGDEDDFQYVLAHNTMTVTENIEMQRFLLWARATAEHLIFRHIWSPLRELAGMTQSAVIMSLSEWFEASEHPSAVELTALRLRLGMQPSAVPTFLRRLLSDGAVDELFQAWWREAVVPRLPEAHADFLSEVFRYDCLTRPIYDDPEADGMTVTGLELVDLDGETYYRRAGVRFCYDIPTHLQRLATGEHSEITRQPIELTFYYKTGYCKYYANHEEGAYFPGRSLDELRRTGQVLTPAAADVSLVEKGPGQARPR